MWHVTAVAQTLHWMLWGQPFTHHTCVGCIFEETPHVLRWQIDLEISFAQQEDVMRTVQV